mgnify:CR=1 FL=1
MRESETQVQVIGSFDSESLFRPVGDHDQMQSILQACGRGYFVVGILSAGQEPTNHALKDMAALGKDFEKWGRKIVLLFPDEKQLKSFHPTEFPNLPSTITLGVDQNQTIQKMIQENMKLSHLENKTIRFITEDVIKFIEREKRRGRTYHGIIMDPPSYGRGPNKEVWKFENDFPTLLSKVKDILDEDFSFLLISSYTTGISHISLENILKLEFKGNKIETGENTLPVTENNLILPCGIYGKVTKD